MRKHIPFIVLFLGIALFSILIGTLTGLSSTPVITIVIPLIFSILTAGGVIYILKNDNDEKTYSIQYKSVFLGLQFSILAIGFTIGVWGGVQIKLTPDLVWAINSRNTPAYENIKFTDIRLLPASIKLDKIMINSGLEYSERVRIFLEIETARNTRKEEFKKSAYITNDLLREWSNPELKSTHEIVIKFQELIDTIQDSEIVLTEDQESIVSQVSDSIEHITNANNFNYGNTIQRILNQYKESLTNYQDHSQLLPNEIKAIDSIISNNENIKPSNSPYNIFTDPIIVDTDNNLSRGGT